MLTVREAYLHAAGSAATLLGQPAVAESWTRPSALEHFQVSGLAGHLAWQIFSVPRALAEPVPATRPVALLDHYERGRWVGAGLMEEANISIRRGGEQVAAGGARTLAGEARAALAELGPALADEPGGRVVQLPWCGWSLYLDDLLTTRLLEIAVHSDDLALSVGIDTPALAQEALDLVFALLARLAARRHGPTAVLRAFSRAERAPGNVAAF